MKYIAALAAALIALTAMTVGNAHAEPSGPPDLQRMAESLPVSGPKPNIVVILTDDQAEGTMDAMPYTRSLMAQQGVTLSNGIIPTSLCCPSRTSLLTGKYSRHTGVYQNVVPDGGWPTFFTKGTEAHTLPVALHGAGYYTGLFGKYLNGYDLRADYTTADYIPPGWDQFRTIYDPTGNPNLGSGAYYDYDIVGTSPTQHYGSDPQDYSTDVLSALSVNFIQNAPAYQPLFLYYAPSGPHAPYTPAPRDIGTWHNEPLNPSASQLTKNRPSFWPDRLLNYDSQQDHLRMQHEALMSVDDGVRDIVNALGDRASNTLFVFMSDNGVQFGEHGLDDKNTPYSGSTDVPMFLRWEGVLTPDSTYRGLMTNADISVTMADAAGVSLDNPDGVSYFASNRPTSDILEAVGGDVHAPYCGIRTDRYVYAEYSGNAGRELYDYNKDPNELVNVVGQASYADTVANLRARTKDGCSPKPPGFTWNN